VSGTSAENGACLCGFHATLHEAPPYIFNSIIIIFFLFFQFFRTVHLILFFNHLIGSAEFLCVVLIVFAELMRSVIESVCNLISKQPYQLYNSSASAGQYAGEDSVFTVRMEGAYYNFLHILDMRVLRCSKCSAEMDCARRGCYRWLLPSHRGSPSKSHRSPVISMTIFQSGVLSSQPMVCVAEL
jgi:hypothetical protein